MGHSEERAEGAGPFITRLTWRLEEGGTAVWESRAARKRGTLAVRPAGAAESSQRRADTAALARLRRLNGVAAGSFTLGGVLFAVGAALAQFSTAGPLVSATVYFIGGVFFTLGGYAALAQTINAPRREGTAGELTSHGFRWWSYEPGRVDWLSTFLLFQGTLVFGVNLLDSFLQGLTARQMNRLVWTPDMIGCALFLVSGQLAVIEVCHGRPCFHRRSLGWWIVAVNQLGSALFMVSALAAFSRPATGSLVNVGVANWGTLTGALCFAVAGVLQAYERP
ncbi:MULTISPECIES: hypothetical protein [Streptomyces]|uniref:NADH-ubiquinone oxidoreductase n=1 Tax=Streptomyces auratus AGR0001 TaxID=1160718 RepID=J1ZPI5_9ACTN|nr:hypothetical protein [Streptomyces auratus]QTZ90738.1 hypothetical protein SU9_004025 [Streptomyces auratus AGR0001]